MTLPGKKAKIYAYLCALLGKSDKEQQKAQFKKRDYTDHKHWNFDAKYLEPLCKFLPRNIDGD